MDAGLTATIVTGGVGITALCVCPVFNVGCIAPCAYFAQSVNMMIHHKESQPGCFLPAV